MTSNPRSLADIGEGAISIVAEQPARCGLVEVRNAVSVFAILAGAAILVLGLGELHELADKQVELPVIVIIEPDRARAPARSGDARPFGDIGERTVAVVVIENAAAVLRNVEVGKSISIVVPHGYALSVAPGCDARFFGDIGKTAVVIIAVEGVAQGWSRVKEVTFATVHEIDIHPAVIVVVEECTSGTRRLRQILRRGFTAGVRPGNAAQA